MTFESHCINCSLTIKDALIALNNLRNATLTLFVLNDNAQIIGTLTDGDIRRALVNGYGLDCTLDKVMHRDYKFICQKEFTVANLRSFRDRRIMFIPILDGENHVVDVVNLQKFKSKLPIDAVLMAGGKGERLRPLTEKTPKPLLEVGGKCIIDHNVDRLISYGVEHVNVTVNYLGEQIEEHFDTPRDGVQVRTFREPKFLGTIGSIKFVDIFYNDTILVMNSDLLTAIDFEKMWKHHMKSGADLTMGAVPYVVSVPFAIMQTDGTQVKGLEEKPTYNYFANAGVYMMRRELLDRIPQGEYLDAPDFITSLIADGRRVEYFPIEGRWIDIGSPDDYRTANELLSK